MNILVIDDDQPILEAMKIILKDLGHKTFVYEDAAQIKNILKSTSPDLIFMDIALNGYDGCEIIKKLKHDKKYMNIPIIILSANNAIEKIQKETGANDFLPKPFSLDDLQSLIKRFQK